VGKRLQDEMVRSSRAIWIGAGDDLHDRELSMASSIQTAVAMLLQAHEKSQGIVFLSSAQRAELTESEAHLLTAIAYQIALAIERTKLLDGIAQIELASEIDRLQSRLIANVSHELRTPLSLIEISSSSLLADDVTYDGETQRKFLRIIEQETARLSAIVDNLLGLYRVENGGLWLYKQLVDITGLVRSAVERVKLLSPSHHIQYEVPPGELWAMADALACEQVTYNLLSNACKYAPEGTTIAIRAGTQNGEVVVEIQDWGIGISTQELGHVFDRFYRGEHERVKSVRGAGLGLSVCQEIIQAHGGRIWLESTAGAGTSAFFALPIADVPS
jgi:K+-sensing histidine kinase KdpD